MERAVSSFPAAPSLDTAAADFTIGRLAPLPSQLLVEQARSRAEISPRAEKLLPGALPWLSRAAEGCLHCEHTPASPLDVAAILSFNVLYTHTCAAGLNLDTGEADQIATEYALDYAGYHFGEAFAPKLKSVLPDDSPVKYLKLLAQVVEAHNELHDSFVRHAAICEALKLSLSPSAQRLLVPVLLRADADGPLGKLPALVLAAGANCIEMLPAFGAAPGGVVLSDRSPRTALFLEAFSRIWGIDGNLKVRISDMLGRDSQFEGGGCRVIYARDLGPWAMECAPMTRERFILSLARSISPGGALVVSTALDGEEKVSSDLNGFCEKWREPDCEFLCDILDVVHHQLGWKLSFGAETSTGEFFQGCGCIRETGFVCEGGVVLRRPL